MCRQCSAVFRHRCGGLNSPPSRNSLAPKLCGVLWRKPWCPVLTADWLPFSDQVDVLETQFSQLLEKIDSTHDFETIKHSHESFVTTLQSQLFFFLPPVSPNTAGSISLQTSLFPPSLSPSLPPLPSLPVPRYPGVSMRL